ncbi:MAG: HAD-IC family P-type ATPase, partial [Gemmatimonadales bacterium]
MRLHLMRYRIPISAFLFILIGGAATFLPAGPSWRHGIWMAGLLITSAPILWSTVRGMTRGKFAADVVASLAVLASLLLGQPVVGLVIVLMQSGGEALEHLAEGRATDALRALEEAVPTTLHRVIGGSVEDVDVDLVRQGDTILVRPGEMVPCDGEVVKGNSHVDTSSLTGEPMPERVTAASKVMSGSINQEGPLVIRVLAVAQESQYARIVALVREAQGSKTPLQRIADRYAVLFTPLTLIVCAVAYGVSGEWSRVLAVLAIATPCPLILATPVAVLGGMNQSARRQILMRNGGALEALGTITTVLFDKTGTITIGRPYVSRVIASNSVSETEVLRLASAVEQGSGHLLARTLIREAERRGIGSATATDVVESPGQGVEGEVEGLRVAVGARSFIMERHPGTRSLIEKADRADGSKA